MKAPAPAERKCTKKQKSPTIQNQNGGENPKHSCTNLKPHERIVENRNLKKTDALVQTKAKAHV